MASTYTNSLRLELMATGENENTWGTKANTVFQLIEDSVAGVLNKDCSAGGTITLTTNNSATDEARNATLLLSGAPAAAFTIVIPNKEKVYHIHNTSGKTATIQTSAPSTSIAVLHGSKDIIYCDGSNNVYSFLGNPKVTFSVTRGGSNQSTVTHSTFTKVQLNTEDWDIGGNYDNATNYRWTPPAGKYRVTCSLKFLSGANIDADVVFYVSLYKNGTAFRTAHVVAADNNDGPNPILTCLVDANGTDYFEMWGRGDGGSGDKTFSGDTTLTYMCGEAI